MPQWCRSRPAFPVWRSSGAPASSVRPFQGRVETGPSDAVENDVARADGSDKSIRIEPRQNNAVVGKIQAISSERLSQSLFKQIGDSLSTIVGKEDELAVGCLERNAGKDLIELRQIFEKRLAAPKGRSGSAQPEFRASQCDGRNLRRFIIDRQVGKSDQVFGVMFLSSRRLHQIAADVVVERRKSAGGRMSPRVELDWSRAVRCELRGDSIHSHFRGDQHMQRVSQYRLAPAIKGKRPLHEPLAQRGGSFGFRILPAAGIIPEKLEPLPIELSGPAFDRSLPDRM